jgi:hypothetical protein
MDTNVELSLKQRVNRTCYWELKVSSEVRPGLKSVGILEHVRTNQRQHLGTLGGAMAEELCEKYNDTLDPSSVASVAMEAYDEIVATTITVEFGDEQPRVAGKYSNPGGGMARH